MACAAAVLAVLLVALMGCTGNGSSGPNPGPAHDRNTGGTESSPGSYHQETYFAVDCSGTWHAVYGSDWRKVHGSFTLTGNIPFLMEYDYHTMTDALYTDTNAGHLDTGNVMHLQSEYSEIVSDGHGNLLPCHFTYDGYQYADAGMEYNTSGDSPSRWTATFSHVSANKPLPPETVKQTEPSCPVTEYTDPVPTELTGPAESCYSNGNYEMDNSPFSFSDNAEFPVIDTVDTSDYYTFDKLDPTATFHLGRAPS